VASLDELTSNIEANTFDACILSGKIDCGCAFLLSACSLPLDAVA
jgi:hypothetical protein